MNSLAAWLSTIRLEYNVDPVVFGVLYIVHSPLLWYSVAHVLLALHRRQFGRAGCFAVLYLFSLSLPYGYVLIFGRNLPEWIRLVMIALVVAAAGAFFLRARRLLAVTSAKL